MKITAIARITIDKRKITKQGTINKSYRIATLLETAIKNNHYVGTIPISIK